MPIPGEEKLKRGVHLSHSDYVERFTSFYQDNDVVEQYLRKRFAFALWRMAHLKEIHIINKVLGEITGGRLLEIAPGPARVTERLSFSGTAVALDYSPKMLQVASGKLKDKKWHLIRGDAFTLPIKEKSFDSVLILRFIRHFDRPTRYLLLQEINRVLISDGLLIFEALNRRIGESIRRSAKLHGNTVYDYLWILDELKEELREAGFRVLKAHPIVNHYFLENFISKLFAPFVRTSILGVGIIALIDIWKSKKCFQWEIICQKI